MIIKVCGMRDGNNIAEVASLGIDWLGMIFWKQSPRYVRMIPTGAGIIPDHTSIEGNCTGNKVKRVGVFVDDMAQNIITRAVNYRLDYIQLHGNETPTLIRNLRATLQADIRPDIGFIKSISVENADDLKRCEEYDGCVDFFLFDTRCKCVGGSGRQFDWNILQHYRGSTPFLLSGGIGPGDAERIKTFRHPAFAGIDLNSRFETEPGVKDATAIKAFLDSLGDAR
ncbi:MAG: phosphoribosylanthranilate isomerase [Prevotella sp.]